VRACSYYANIEDLNRYYGDGNEKETKEEEG
jgi:hypothetical protein